MADICEFAQRAADQFRESQESIGKRFNLDLSEPTVEDFVKAAFYASMIPDEGRYPTAYLMSYLNFGIADSHIVLTDALLAERSRIEKPDTGAMAHFWEVGKRLLLKPDATTKRPGFITANAELHEAAAKMNPHFERAFGLTSVLDALHW